MTIVNSFLLFSMLTTVLAQISNPSALTWNRFQTIYGSNGLNSPSTLKEVNQNSPQIFDLTPDIPTIGCSTYSNGNHFGKIFFELKL